MIAERMLNSPTAWRIVSARSIAVFLFGLCLMGISPASAQFVPQGQAPIRDPQHVMQRHVANYVAIKRANIVMQQRDFSCGAAALATLIRYYWGDNVTEHQILVALDKIITDPRERLERVQNGLSMTDLRRAAVAEGYLSVIGTLTFKELAEAKAPVLVGIVVGEYDHFVVFRGADSYYVYLADPARGNLRIPIWQFLNEWQENAVLVVAKPDVDPPEVSPLTVREDEKSVGWTNRQMIRSRLSKTHATLPLPLFFIK
jgi:predicted double-glycine peptidase